MCSLAVFLQYCYLFYCAATKPAAVRIGHVTLCGTEWKQTTCHYKHPLGYRSVAFVVICVCERIADSTTRLSKYTRAHTTFLFCRLWFRLTTPRYTTKLCLRRLLFAFVWSCKNVKLLRTQRTSLLNLVLLCLPVRSNVPKTNLANILKCTMLVTREETK